MDYKTVNKKQYAIGAALVVGIYLLWPGKEPSDAVKKVTSTGSHTQIQPISARPARPARSRDSAPTWSGEQSYGRALEPSYGNRYGDQRSPGRAPEPAAYGYRPRFGSGYPVAQQAEDPGAGFRFRPLSDSEKRRYDYQTPPERYEPSRSYGPATAPAPSYGTRPGYPSGGYGGYTFRPLEQTPESAERWQGPYPDPMWRGERDYADQNGFEREPQWGARPYTRPPIDHMYPSLNLENGRTLSAR